MVVRRLVGGAAVAGIAVFGGIGAIGDDTTRNDQGEVVEAGGVGAFSIQYGDCIQFPDAVEIVSVEAVPCATPHNAQAFDAFDVTSHDSYPGEPVLQELAYVGCVERFESFVGVAFEESELFPSSFYPTAGSWSEGDREIQCFVGPETGKISFNAEQSGR